MTPCADCGMECEPGEYHPYAACLLFRALGSCTEVRAHLDAIRASALRRAAAIAFDVFCRAAQREPGDGTPLNFPARWMAAAQEIERRIKASSPRLRPRSPTMADARALAKQVGRDIRKHLFIARSGGVRDPSPGLSWEADDIIEHALLAYAAERERLLAEADGVV